MRIALLYGLLSVICGAYGLSALAITQEQPESEHMAKVSASTQAESPSTLAARQDQARLLASMITGRINFVEKNKQLENQLSEIKRRKDECQATFTALNTTIRNHLELKRFLNTLAYQIGFPYGIQAITQHLDQQTQKIMREIKMAEREMRKTEKDIKKYEREKARLITEVEKSPTTTKSSTQATQPSLASRAWAWVFGAKPATTEPRATESGSFKHISELENLKITHTQLILSISKATNSLNSFNQKMAVLQKERLLLMSEIETISQDIVNRLYGSDVFTNEQELNDAKKSMENLRKAYFNLGAIYIGLHEMKERKYDLLFEIQGMEQTDY